MNRANETSAQRLYFAMGFGFVAVLVAIFNYSPLVAVVLSLLCYASMAIVAFRNVFGTLLNNAKKTAAADFKYMSELSKCSLCALENVLLEVKAERDFFERRMGILVGALEKIGVIPGLGLLALSFFKITAEGNWVWNGVWFLAIAVPPLYAMAMYGHFVMMRLDRKAKLLELLIARQRGSADNKDQSPVHGVLVDKQVG